jgi:hypothetical protein
MLELVICGRSVEIGLCAWAPQVCALAWDAWVAAVMEIIERNSAHFDRCMEKIITEGLRQFVCRRWRVFCNFMRRK